MASKWNDRNSSVTDSFCHRAGAAHGKLSTAEGLVLMPLVPLASPTMAGPAAAAGEQHLPAGALWPWLGTLINLLQPQC